MQQLQNSFINKITNQSFAHLFSSNLNPLSPTVINILVMSQSKYSKYILVINIL